MIQQIADIDFISREMTAYGVSVNRESHVRSFQYSGSDRLEARLPVTFPNALYLPIILEITSIPYKTRGGLLSSEPILNGRSNCGSNGRGAGEIDKNGAR